MLKNKRTRRTTAVVMMILGGLLMFLAPEIWQGAILLALGIGLELVGITLEHLAK